jgi:hypothetical protein
VLEPVFFEVQGDVAYAVFPVKVKFTQASKAQVENLYLTTGLTRDAGRWRIARLIYSSLGRNPSDQPRP